jgi:hypothetical protein
MPSGTNVSENISPPSSGFLRVIGLHNCVTLESMFVSPSIEAYYITVRYPEDRGDMFC